MTPPTDLLAAAKRAWENAYAPYSRFRVGAALRTDRGTLFAGSNVENASYGLTRCAEQSALQAMASAGERSFTELLVYTDADPPAAPCGACRQIMREFSADAPVHMVNAQGTVRTLSVAELLPGAFELG